MKKDRTIKDYNTYRPSITNLLVELLLLRLDPSVYDVHLDFSVGTEDSGLSVGLESDVSLRVGTNLSRRIQRVVWVQIHSRRSLTLK